MTSDFAMPIYFRWLLWFSMTRLVYCHSCGFQDFNQMFSLWCYRDFDPPTLTWFKIWFWYASSIFFSCTFSQQLYWEVPHPAQCMSTLISLALHLYGRETNGGILRCEQSKLLWRPVAAAWCKHMLGWASLFQSTPRFRRFQTFILLAHLQKCDSLPGVEKVWKSHESHESHEDLKGVSHKLCCVMAHKIPVASRAHHVHGSKINALS